MRGRQSVSLWPLTEQLVIARGESMWKGWRPFLMSCATGALFAADLSFWHRSIHYIGPGLSTIFGNFQVFFLAAFGVFVFHEKIDWKFLVSMLTWFSD